MTEMVTVLPSQIKYVENVKGRQLVISVPIVFCAEKKGLVIVFAGAEIITKLHIGNCQKPF